MTPTSIPSQPSVKTTKRPNTYAAVWRWHFWAGLLASPILVILSVTGAIYLFKPQYEAWRYQALLSVQPGAQTASLDAQFAALAAAIPPGATPEIFQPPISPSHSAWLQYRDAARLRHTVFVNQYSLEILGHRNDETTLMQTTKLIHGSLLLGDWGDYIVELGASWSFALLVTGFYLWWPRPFRLGGFLFPRLRKGKRALLIDLHAVPMIWFSGFALFLLASGIPWSGIGGQWFKQIGQALGEWQPRETAASAHRSELLGGWSPYLNNPELANSLETLASSQDSHAAPSPIPLERVAQIANEQNVTDAYAIALPRGPQGVYSVLSDRNQALTRTYLHLDQYSGKVLADVRFKDFGRLAQFFTFGIIVHEGQFFGLANQLLGLLTCLFLVSTSVTAFLMWRSRKPPNGFGAPQTSARLPIPLVASLLASGILFPLLAASFLLLLAIDFATQKSIRSTTSKST